MLVHSLNDFMYCYLSTTDPQPPLSRMFKIFGLDYLKNSAKIIIWIQWLVMTSRLIGSSLFDLLSSPVRAQIECCRSRDHFSCLVEECSTTRIPFSSIMVHHLRLSGSLVEGVILLLHWGLVGVFYSTKRVDR